MAVTCSTDYGSEYNLISRVQWDTSGDTFAPVMANPHFSMEEVVATCTIGFAL